MVPPLMPTRDPLGPIDLNRPSTSSSSSSRKSVKLAPIFTNSHSTRTLLPQPQPPSSPYNDENSSPTPHARKRPRLDLSGAVDKRQDEEDVVDRPSCSKRSSMADFFATTGSSSSETRSRSKQVITPPLEVPPVIAAPVGWVRKRSRIGVNGGRGDRLLMRATTDYNIPRSILSTLVTSTAPYDPEEHPSKIFLPSHHCPTGQSRDYSPPLSVAFNSIAKNYDSASAKSFGKQRLLAIGGEEGGVRILNVDEGLGQHREGEGHWWRAHSNAVFDIKWSADDTRILTASGDQTTRVHSLDGGAPQVVATMRGHTSSVKTTTFFDPTRSHSDPSVSSSIIASAGRDGNILIFDLRCQGRISDSPSPLVRPNYSRGIDGFCAQKDTNILEPVMTIRAAHGEGSRRNNPSHHRTALRSVTSLVALQSMPGMLASGGSYDGIVKLWDLRFPATEKKTPKPSVVAWGELPDPTTNCANPSRRARSVNALVESPTTGDLFAMCGDSKIHALRPACARASDEEMDHQAILPRTYTDPELRVSTFYLRASVSPDGKTLACGSSQGGIMAWDLNGKVDTKGEVKATRLGFGGRADTDVGAIDWGHDMIAGCAGDSSTRIWRSKHNADDLIKTGDWKGRLL